MASNGAAAIKIPSERLETMLDAHMRLKAGPMTETLYANGWIYAALDK
jgi:hypothetical protein